MTPRCRMCRRVRIRGRYRLAFPGERLDEVRESFCPACAEETMARLRAGEPVYDRLAPDPALASAPPARLEPPAAPGRAEPLV